MSLEYPCSQPLILQHVVLRESISLCSGLSHSSGRSGPLLCTVAIKNHRDNHNTTFVQSLNLSIKKTGYLEQVPALAYLPHHHLITIMEPPWAHSALPSTCDIKST